MSRVLITGGAGFIGSSLAESLLGDGVCVRVLDCLDDFYDPASKRHNLELLAAGGTKRHKELLAPFGLDASDPKFWDKGLSMISGLIDELEAMED